MRLPPQDEAPRNLRDLRVRRGGPGYTYFLFRDGRAIIIIYSNVELYLYDYKNKRIPKMELESYKCLLDNI